MATPSFNEATHEDGRGIDKLFHWLSHEKSNAFFEAELRKWGAAAAAKPKCYLFLLLCPSHDIPTAEMGSERGRGKKGGSKDGRGRGSETHASVPR